MRMPIVSYFIVVGAVLTGLLIWFGDDGELESAPLRTSQQIGIPKPSATARRKSPRRSPPSRSRGTRPSSAPGSRRPRGTGSPNIRTTP